MFQVNFFKTNDKDSVNYQIHRSQKRRDDSEVLKGRSDCYARESQRPELGVLYRWWIDRDGAKPRPATASKRPTRRSAQRGGGEQGRRRIEAIGRRREKSTVGALEMRRSMECSRRRRRGDASGSINRVRERKKKREEKVCIKGKKKNKLN